MISTRVYSIQLEVLKRIFLMEWEGTVLLRKLIGREDRSIYILGGPVQSDNMLVRPTNQIPLPKIYYKRDLEWNMQL